MCIRDSLDVFPRLAIVEEISFGFADLADFFEIAVDPGLSKGSMQSRKDSPSCFSLS